MTRLGENTDARIFLLEAWTVFYSFAAAASRSDWPSSMIADPWSFLRMAIPATVVLVVLLLRDSYADLEARTPVAVVMDMALALAFAFLSQELLAIIAPALILPRWRATQGFAVAWFFLTALRAGFPPGPKVSLQGPSETPLRIEEVRWKAEECVRVIRQLQTGGYLVAGVLVLLFSLSFALTKALRVRAAAAIVVIGLLCIVWQIRRGTRPGEVPADGGFDEYRDFHRREMERGHAVLQVVRRWYVGVVVPGIVLFLLGSPFYGYVVLMYAFLIVELMSRAIRSLESVAGGSALQFEPEEAVGPQ